MPINFTSLFPHVGKTFPYGQSSAMSTPAPKTSKIEEEKRLITNEIRAELQDQLMVMSELMELKPSSTITRASVYLQDKSLDREDISGFVKQCGLKDSLRDNQQLLRNKQPQFKGNIEKGTALLESTREDNDIETSRLVQKGIDYQRSLLRNSEKAVSCCDRSLELVDLIVSKNMRRRAQTVLPSPSPGTYEARERQKTV